MNALSIFEKYIGPKSSSTTTISSNIKDINQAIGALQTLNIALNKCQNALHNPQELDLIIKNSAFMGEALFESEILIPDMQKSLFIPHLGTMLQEHSQEEVSCFIQSKQEEISNILEAILCSLDDEGSYTQEEFGELCIAQ